MTPRKTDSKAKAGKAGKAAKAPKSARAAGPGAGGRTAAKPKFLAPKSARTPAMKAVIARVATAKALPAKTAKPVVASRPVAAKPVTAKLAAQKPATPKPVAQKPAASKPAAPKAAPKSVAPPVRRPPLPTPVSAPAQVEEVAAFGPADRDRLERILLTERGRLLKEMGHLEDTVLNRSLRDSSGELSGYSFHMADIGTDAMEREKAFLFASAEGRALLDVNEALRRLYNGEYGVCESCGRPISVARLEVVPQARLCVRCKEKEERGQGSHVR